MQLFDQLLKEDEVLAAKLSPVIYDVELLSKGILLKSSIEFEKVLRELGNQDVMAKYQRSKEIESELPRLRMNIQTEADLQKIIDLQQENQTLQLDIYQNCLEYADFTNYISYTWKDVYNALQMDDIAVEFVSIKDGLLGNEDRIVALILTKELPQPVALSVGLVSSISEWSKLADFFENGNVGQQIWGFLSNYGAGKKRLFFSADGILNQMAIEYLQYNGKNLSDQMEVYRLSSTKELCYVRTKNALQLAALMGDIDYNMEGVLAETTKRSAAEMRGNETIAFINLPNTFLEITEIKSILEKNRVEPKIFLTGEAASEKAFKQLDNTKINILHVATHGAYWSSDTTSDRQSMDNSFLVFAGANLHSENAEEDGLVTAADIAKMNFRQCDLAVLSACETGLGKLGDDGVYGLQRGFKNAGVHTLLMSLRNVNDASTAEMMISFYSYLMKGTSKRESLIRAQQDLKAKGYTDSEFWASFILLDAF